MEKLRKWLPSLLIFAVLLASVAAGAAYGKYIFGKAFTGTVTLNADLGSITLLESKANPNGDGSYTLDKTTPVTGNTYQIIPGLDIPKDPYVTIKNKSSIPVYVFVEVCTTIPKDSAAGFEIDDANWKKISSSENNGKHGGTVYVYTGGGAGPKIVKQDSDFASPVYILKNNEVIIGQELRHDAQTDLGLKFYASMGQIATDGEQLADVYARVA